ncbi:MAG: sigma 54-interacting transcriptional regulator [Polyangiaceae bacterium]|jgi:DNA-binding NtrC family response regulator
MSTIEPDRPSAGTLEIAVFNRTRSWAVEVQDDVGARRIILTRARVVVGSSSAADIVTADATVSGKHLALSVAPGGVLIQDLGSKNGTFVGGARVTEARGDTGTTVLLGRSTLTLRGMGPEEEADEEAEPLDGVAGGSLVMRRIAARVRRFAANALPVLVTGETGTGKELVARALHVEGPRAQAPFVALNVASLPRELVESELFGHERGAFTGAVSKRLGAFSEADRGTLFLDEIGDLPLDAQPKLLRALDGYEVRRIGATGRGRVGDVRIVAATNRLLARSVEEGVFRRDLFHRLSVFTVTLPPLRERRGDIGPIARALLASAPEGVNARTVTPRALARLLAHDWSGNVRELRAVLYRASDHAQGARSIDLDDVEEGLRLENDEARVVVRTDEARALLNEHRGNVTHAARAAGMPRSTFRKRLRGK